MTLNSKPALKTTQSTTNIGRTNTVSFASNVQQPQLS